ncbi:MAG: hypothetical protein KJZ80_20190 [Hyphomicrobiaceae bacterium]|nr:hypothetical protein [Hyphomicrobiaceae bacterium]
MTVLRKPAGTHPTLPADRISGWIEAALYVLTIAVVSVLYAMANEMGAHVVVFILYSLLVSALGMLAITGLGSDAVRIMLAPQSWFVGLATIVLEGAYCLMLLTMSPAEGNLLVRLSIPIALLIGWLWFGRVPGPGIWIGAGIVCAGVAALAFTLDPAAQGLAVLYGLVSAFMVSSRGFATEFHPWNRAARNVVEKMRVTGLVVLVTALASLLLVGLAVALVSAGVLTRNDLVPAPADIWHVPTILMALLVGGAMFTAMSYLQFSCVVKIRTENLIATGAFMPIATLLVQSLAAALGLVTVAALDWRLLPGMLIVVAGVMVLIGARRRER